MNVQALTAPANNSNRKYSAKISLDVPAFTIPRDTEQTREKIIFQNDPDADPVSAMESMTGKISAPEPSYSVTDEEAEYFREKYGDTYNEEKARELYYELADKGIISINDAARSSGTSVAMPLSTFNSITYFGGGDPYGLRNNLNRDIGFVSDRVYIKDVSRTDKDSPYKILWDNFKKTYDREINTWEDALKENIEFERYRKDRAEETGASAQWHFDKVLESLERTKGVIFRIFGE